MFESIKANLTTRNVLLGLGAVAVVGVAVYAFCNNEKVDLSDKGVQDILDAAGVVASDAAETVADVAANAADVVAEKAA